MNAIEGERIAELLREAVTVLDEPFHHESIAAKLLEAADLLSSQAARIAELEAERVQSNRIIEQMHDELSDMSND